MVNHAAAGFQAKGTPTYVARIRGHQMRILYAARVGNLTQLVEGKAMIRNLDPKERCKARLVRTHTNEVAQATLASTKPTP